DPVPRPSAEEAKDDEPTTPPGAARVPPAPGPEPGPRGGQPDGPPPQFLDPERPGGSFRQPPRYGPPPGSPRDTGPMPTVNRQDDNAWGQPPAWQPPHSTRPAGQTALPQPPASPWPGQPLPPQSHGAEAPPPPPASYAERIRV